MKKNILSIFLATALSVVSLDAISALVTNTLLAFDGGSIGCPLGAQCVTNDGNMYGSWWAFDFDANGVLDESDKVAMTPGYDGGIVIGKNQQEGPGLPVVPAPPPTGSGIDEPVSVFSSTAWHETTNPVVQVNDYGLSKELNFSGWNLHWQDQSMFLGGDGANFSADTGLATITCSTIDCAIGDAFSLDYTAHLALGDPSGMGGFSYWVHLEGTISSVPIPAALWLFGSGLLGLIGLV